MVMLFSFLVITFGAVSFKDCSVEPIEFIDRTLMSECVSDIKIHYVHRGLAEGVGPYDNDPQWRDSKYEPVVGGNNAENGVLEYPVGSVYFMQGAAWITHAIHGFPDMDERYEMSRSEMWETPEIRNEVMTFFWVNIFLMSLLFIATIPMIASLTKENRALVIAYGLSPLLHLEGYISWDLLTIPTVVAAVYFWEKRKFAWVGFFIGLGTAIKLFPFLMLGAVFTLAVRNREWKSFVYTTVSAVLTWVACNAPAYLQSRELWSFFWEFNMDRGAYNGSWWSAWANIVGESNSLTLINNTFMGFTLVACLAIFVWGLRSKNVPTFAQLSLLIMLAFFFLNKVYSPQYDLFILALLVLSVKTAKIVWAWVGLSIMHYITIWPFVMFEYGAAFEINNYIGGIVIRMIAQIVIVVWVVRSIHLDGCEEKALRPVR